MFGRWQTTEMIVSVAGNIGSGKSTLLRYLKKSGCFVLLEGVNRNKWKGLLSKYYENPRKYSFLFQTIILLDMNEEWEKFTDLAHPIIFTERSCIDTLAFATLIHSEGNMSDEEFDTFKQLYTKLGSAPDLVINLKVKPTVCYDRICYRDREGEDKISLDYLQKFSTASEKILKESGIKCVDVEAENITPSELASLVLGLVKIDR